MAELTESHLQIYSPEKTKKWLSYLARGMIAHNQTIFMIERLQPSWLPITFLQWIYLLISRVTIILVGSSVLIYIGAYFRLKLLIASVIVGILISIGEIAYKWLFSHIDMDRFRYLSEVIILLSYPTFVLISVFTILAVSPQPGSEYGFLIIIWIIQILVFFGFRSALIKLNQDIKAVESISFSLKRLMIVAFIGLCFISCVVLIPVVDEDTSYNSVQLVGLGSCLSVLVVPVFLSGFKKSVQDIGRYPNQGLILSIRNAMLICGLIALYFSILFAIHLFVQHTFNIPKGYSDIESLTPTSAFFTGAITSYYFGPFLGLFGILFFGGNFIVKHFTLRCLLSLFGYLPWNLARFLDYCVDLNFLQKVGGGYLFIHKYVMEHFAEMQL